MSKLSRILWYTSHSEHTKALEVLRSFAALAGKFLKIIIIFGALLHFRAHFWSILTSQFWWFFVASGNFFHHFQAPGAPRTSRYCSDMKFKPLQKIEFFIIFWAGFRQHFSHSRAMTQTCPSVEIQKNIFSLGQNWFKPLWMFKNVRKWKN